MNERIRELAEQAEGTKKHVPAVWQFYDHELEKFSELIVRECLEQVRFEVQYEYNLGLADSVSERVLEHFGVE